MYGRIKELWLVARSIGSRGTVAQGNEQQLKGALICPTLRSTRPLDASVDMKTIGIEDQEPAWI